MDGGAWKVAVHGVAEGRTRLSNFTFTFHFHALEKVMATHSSVFAWRIPGTGEPGGLPSMGLHRVGHNWSDLAAAAVVKFHYLGYMNVGIIGEILVPPLIKLQFFDAHHSYSYIFMPLQSILPFSHQVASSIQTSIKFKNFTLGTEELLEVKSNPR